MTAETDVKGYCIDITNQTINVDVCSVNFLKVVSASGTRSIECGGSGLTDKCAICTAVASFSCISGEVPIMKAANEYIYTC